MHVARFSLAALLGALFTTPVIGQDPGRLSGPAVNQPCMECGVIFDIRSVTTEREVAKKFDDHPLEGPFIKFPLSRDPAAKPEVGVIGSKEMREQLEQTVYEVVVRFDDNRFTLIEVSDVSNLHVGDRVHVHQNRIEPVDTP